MGRRPTPEEVEEAKRAGTFVSITQGLDGDWIRAGRLMDRAEAGDKEAARELEEMKKDRAVPANEL